MSTLKERARKRWAQLIDMKPEQERVLQSLRFRDQDHHAKSAAILGFSGLLITSNLVQFSAQCGSIAYLPPSGGLFEVTRLGFGALMGSSILSLISMSLGRLRPYSDDPWTALNQLAHIVGLRMWVEGVAICLCAGGAFGSLFSLFLTLFAGGVAGQCGSVRGAR